MTKTQKKPLSNESTRKLALSADDRDHLEQFEELLDIVRDRTEALAQRRHNAVLFVGRPGIGKTHTVEQTLRGLDTPWCTWNARMSPMGLWSVMHENPESVIVVDDLGTLFSASNQSALQVLLAALGGEPGKPRRVSYATKEDRTSFDFVGGIIAIGNALPRRDPVADALVSRARVLEVEPTDAMVAAFLRSLALRGHKDVEPAVALEVVEYIIDVCTTSDYRLDLRQFNLGLEDYRHWNEGSRCHWRTLISSSLEQRHEQECRKPLTRAEQMAREEKIAQQLHQRFPNGTCREERDAQWKALTGKAPAAFYRRLKSLKAEGRPRRPAK